MIDRAIFHGLLHGLLLGAAAGLAIGCGVAYFVCRKLWRDAHQAGYLHGRNFLVKRQLHSRSALFLDGLPVDDVGAVWIETNNFTADERERIALLERQDTGQSL